MDFYNYLEAVTICSLLCLTYKAVYRLLFNPIARFPGPRLAALTFWYEFYYDVVLQGRYTWKIVELHERYGPIVRINPEELHVLDPAFYSTLYVGSVIRPTNKWYWSARMFGTSSAAVGTVDHDLHRHRRSALSPFFSKNHITQLGPRISKHINKLKKRLCQFKGTGIPVNLNHVFTSLTADIIGDLAFGEGHEILGDHHSSSDWHAFMMDLSKNTHLMKQFPSLYYLLTVLPRALVSFIHPLARQLFALEDSISLQIRVAQASAQKGKSPQTDTQQCMLDTLILSPHLAPSDKSLGRLWEESLTLLGAGTVTTAWALSVTCYHVLSKPHILESIQMELRDVCNDASSADYESFPYLSAVISEGLRLSHGTSHRLARISPHTDLQYGPHTIPAGTPVSMTQMHMHLDAGVFPTPNEFLPERWLPECCTESEWRLRRSYLVPFSKGSRMCVGMNLALAELYLTIGRLFGPGGVGFGNGLELFETGEKDVRVARDWFNPVPDMTSQGVRVLVK
ncbi:putative P450 monooxygenase, partial [Pleomassaria siparia CBS 279.74]